MFTSRQKSMIYLALAAIGLILLAASLPVLQFKPGQPIPGAETVFSQSSPLDTVPRPEAPPLLWVLQSALSLVFIVLLGFLVAGLFLQTDIRRLAKIMTGLVALLALLFLLPRVIPNGPELPPGEGTFKLPATGIYSVAPIGNPPAYLYQFVIAGLVLCVIVIGAWLLRQALHKPAASNGMAEAAGGALQAIQNGQDLGSAIITCYLRMTDIVKEERGLEREESVTPREFQEMLAGKGVPEGPIRQLTRLFEQARYGRAIPKPEDERVAVECLTSIQTYCQQYGGKAG